MEEACYHLHYQSLGFAIPGVGNVASALITSALLEGGKRLGTKDVESSYDLDDALEDTGKDYAFTGADAYRTAKRDIGNIGTDIRQQVQSETPLAIGRGTLRALSATKLRDLVKEFGFEEGIKEWLKYDSSEEKGQRKQYLISVMRSLERYQRK